MKGALAFTAVSEAATGLILLIAPSPVSQLLLDEQLSGVAALIALGIACWPRWPPRAGMLIYSGAVALYLAYLGFAGGLNGVLLWLAVILHLILTALLMRGPQSRDL